MLQENRQYLAPPEAVMASQQPDQPPQGDHQTFLRTLTKAYSALLRILCALLPLVMVVYLFKFQNHTIQFAEYGLYESTIVIAILASTFVTYMTWRCYQTSGELFLRWLTLAFLGFTLVYIPHGLFAWIADTHTTPSLLFGPAARLIMGIGLFIGLLNYGKLPDVLKQRANTTYWKNWIGIFLFIDVVISTLALFSLGSNTYLRLSIETVALCMILSSIIMVFMRHIQSPLMTTFYTLSLAYFASALITFDLAQPWSHMWWLAHAIFAAGFFIMSYGVATAFLTTHTFSNVYSQEELMQQLKVNHNRTETILAELRQAHEALERQTAIDALTGAANRTHFLERATMEIARTLRTSGSLCLLAVDIDHFKHINDNFGHQTGDELLKKFVALLVTILRPSDLIGRFGGDEFVIMLPDTTSNTAAMIAERCRRKIEENLVATQDIRKKVTISIGIAQYGLDGNTLETCLNIADKRLYHAKTAGRNQVMAW